MNRKNHFFINVLGVFALLATQITIVNAAESRTSRSISPSSQSVIATQGSAISPTAAYKTTGFSGTVSYSIQPALPGGLSFNPATGVVSGTPQVVSSKANYSITAQSGSAKATATMSLTVIKSSTSTSTSGSSTTVATGLNCPSATQAASESAAMQGRRAYLRLNCYSCHGDYAQGGTMAPSVQGDADDVQEAVMQGESGMPSFAKVICPNDIANLRAYLNGVKTLQTKNAPQLLDWKTYPGNVFTTSAPAFTFH